MKKVFYIAIAFVVLSAASCQKEKEIHPVGSKIVFSGATGYRNGIATRTLYSGDLTETTPAYERIQWISTDKVKILYQNTVNPSSATYMVDGSVSGADHDRQSTANFKVDTGISGNTALEWEGGNTHVFYGIYPSTAGTLSAGSVSGLSVPATQYVSLCSTQGANYGKYLPEDMSYAYMVAYKDMSSDPSGSVPLPFTPVVNAIEFKLKLPDNRPSYTVSQVKFSHATTAIAGAFNVSINGFDTEDFPDAVDWSASSSSTTTGIIVNFKNGSSAASPAIPTNSSGNVLDFTVLTLPVDISSPLLQIKYSDGQIMKVQLTNLTMTAGQKCIVTNNKAGHDVFDYTVTPNTANPPSGNTVVGHEAYTWSDIPVTSIKTSRAAEAAGSSYSEPVAWKVQYKNGGTWTDGVPSTYTLTEDHANNRFTVSLNSANSSKTASNLTPYAAATENLKVRESRGTADAPYDLSTHDLYGNQIGQTSANCYIVTAPGVYKFPLIYGNARVLGRDNSEAYHPTTDSSWDSGTTVGTDDDDQNYYLPTFYNAKGQGITSPYVLTDLNLSLSSVTKGRLSQISDSGIITSSDIGGTDASDAYITFTITSTSIKPGNLVFYANYANFSQSPQYGVIWSWHIWVTDKDLTPSDGVMPYNLGWVDADNNDDPNSVVSKYDTRELELRIVQYETTTDANQQTVTTVLNEGTSFTLTQTGDYYIYNPTNGTNPHYQWGRKDPYPSDKNINLLQHNDAGESTGYWYWRGIRLAWEMLKGEYSSTWTEGKAVPLYKEVQTPNSWTVKAGTYGPYKGAAKDAVRSVLGTTIEEKRKRVTNNSLNFSDFLALDSPNYGIPARLWSTRTVSTIYGNFTGYYFDVGVVLTQAQMTTLSNLCTYYTADHTSDNPPGGNFSGYPLIGFNDYSGFSASCVEDVFYYNVSSPTTITEAQSNTLISNGFPANGITIGYATDYTYTTDAERNAGSILQNLWSAYRYNENCTDPQEGKMKTVYDPCPAGFTVPTKDKLNSGSGYNQYPRTGKRPNTSTSNTAVSNTSNGYYWSDRSCNMSYDSNNSGPKDAITSYTDYDKAYILQTTTSGGTVTKNIRAAAASIRPMVDPRASGIANGSQASVSNQNGIEGVTFGEEL